MNKKGELHPAYILLVPIIGGIVIISALLIIDSPTDKAEDFCENQSMVFEHEKGLFRCYTEVPHPSGMGFTKQYTGYFDYGQFKEE